GGGLPYSYIWRGKVRQCSFPRLRFRIGKDGRTMGQAGQEYLAVYRRDFSELQGLQKAEQITYTLQRTDGALCFKAERRTSAQGASCSLRGLDEAFAARLL